MGPWKGVLDRGAPNGGRVSVGRAAGAVYDLVAHKAVAFAAAGGRTSIDVTYETTDGNVFLVAAKPLGALTVSKETTPDGLRVLVRAPEGDGVLRPVAVVVGKGRPFYGVVRDGQFEHTFAVKGNDAVAVTDLATGAVVR